MIWVLVIAGLIGLCLGSFSTTAALRLVKSEQALVGRSHCDGCASPLSFVSTTPVLSFLVRRGRCADCGARIDPLHLAGELLGGLLVVSALAIAPNWRGLVIAALGLVLLASAVVDARSRRLPDALTVTAALLCLGLAVAESKERLVVGIAAAAVAFAILQGVRWAFRRWRGREALGFGDVKLIAALALWLGLLTPWALAGAAILGLTAMIFIRPADGRLAFGPAIVLAAFLVGLASEALPSLGAS